MTGAFRIQLYVSLASSIFRDGGIVDVAGMPDPDEPTIISTIHARRSSAQKNPVTSSLMAKIPLTYQTGFLIVCPGQAISCRTLYVWLCLEILNK